MRHWTEKHITKHNDKYYAWDETEVSTIGKFDTYQEAQKALEEYAEHINPRSQRRQQHE